MMHAFRLSGRSSRLPLRPSPFTQQATWINSSAAQSGANPPFPICVIYNQSKHSCNSVLADIRAVWGDKVKVLQVIEEGNQKLPNMDGRIQINKGAWGDMDHFGTRLDAACTQDHQLQAQRDAKGIVFMPGWSAFAEAGSTGRAVDKLGMVWPGTEPVASGDLEKIGFKQICERIGAPTPAFKVLSEEGDSAVLGDPAVRAQVVAEYAAAIESMNTSNPGLIKSIHGGGGKGTAHLDDPSDKEQVLAAIDKVFNEMNRSDGIYFEQKVNTKGDGRFFQLELEVDGDKVANGGRFVWFNSRLQKVVEIGLSDKLVPMFMDKAQYEQARVWSQQIAAAAGNNTRATMEALVFTDENGDPKIEFIECNRRPQVENEALALLEQDSDGNRRYTFAELMMRAKGHPAPELVPHKDIECVLHARWLHGNPDSNGDITYQPGVISGMAGPRLDYIASELMSTGEISFTADPQLGKAVLTADSWEQMCDRAVEYFELRGPKIQGPGSTYAEAMRNLFGSSEFRDGNVASNETFKTLKIPEAPPITLTDRLEHTVGRVLTKGYRPGEGVSPDNWPTAAVVGEVTNLTQTLAHEDRRATPFTQYARGETSYGEYVDALKGQLSDQGGAWVTVAPRDTAQQGNDSESAGVCAVSRQNAEVWGERAGCVGYETGGAQFQAGLIRGFDPATIKILGLPYNMPAHSLQRSQYVNGLAELTSDVRVGIFEATAGLVEGHYRAPGAQTRKDVPWFPYNFHAGNYYNPETGYSAQDETTRELLGAGCCPMPNWVFSPRFPISALRDWTGRQIDNFAAHDRELHQVRIKNPGQGDDWTPEAIWAHVDEIRQVFAERQMDEPIVYIHNHDFNGLGGHIGQQVFSIAQGQGFNNIVYDGAYRKNGTHNDNTVLTAGLNLSTEQKEALMEYNHYQQQIEQVLVRFDSRTSQMTPWNSDWAGGTEGSDLRIAKEFGLDPRDINSAKEVASEVFPLERAVTPFSEYKLRLGLAIYIEDAIQPKTADAVRSWVKKGGKLKVGGDVLIGLHRWETLVGRPESVDHLLDNMSSELEDAMGSPAGLVTSVPDHFTTAQKYTALGYQGKGLEFVQKTAGKAGDFTPLLLAPQLLHSKPGTLTPGTKFELLTDSTDTSAQEQIEFLGFGKAANTDVTMNFLHNGQTIELALPDPNASAVSTAVSGPRRADSANPLELGTDIPGELIKYVVKMGDKLKAGDPLCVLESMKMEVKISVPDHLDGHVVGSLPAKGRTAELQGDILKPGDLLLESVDAP